MRNIKDTMGKVYKDKKSKGCALCKPHKHGWAPKKKTKIIALEKEMGRKINEFLEGIYENMVASRR